MSAPVEPFVIITSGQVIGAAVALVVSAAGLVAATMKWSFQRIITNFDESVRGMRREFTQMRADFKVMSDRQHAAEVSAMQRVECNDCRKECQDRILENQRITLENDRIQNQKLDNLLMMVANVHNGLGGVRNGIHTEPKVEEKS